MSWVLGSPLSIMLIERVVNESEVRNPDCARGDRRTQRAPNVPPSRRVAAAIDRDLTYEPMTVARNRKPLPGLSPSFAHVPPVWELRVGDYRVFYDIEHEDWAVFVRAVRFKGQSATEEIT